MSFKGLETLASMVLKPQKLEASPDHGTAQEAHPHQEDLQSHLGPPPQRKKTPAS